VSCKTGYTLKDGACEETIVITCPEGQYNNGTGCSACREGCIICDNYDSCKTCKDKYELKNGICELEKEDDEEDEGSNAGLIAGIVVACVVVVAIAAVAIWCVATAGAKHGKIDPLIYEEDTEFATMSVL